MRAFGNGLDQSPELAVDLLQLATLEAQFDPRLRLSRFASRWKRGDELLHQLRLLRACCGADAILLEQNLCARRWAEAPGAGASCLRDR